MEQGRGYSFLLLHVYQTIKGLNHRAVAFSAT